MAQELNDKYLALQEILRSLGSVVIGYSGGVDSTLLIKVAADVLGENSLAVIGKSATYPSREYEEAVALAESFGAKYEVVATEETDDLKFRENPVNRCYFCKTELFSKLQGIAERRNISWIADGAITDDLGDFRPGMKAKKEHNVRSPLLEAGMSKADVRELSKYLNLPTWNKGSFACLSSRFPYGMGITTANLERVDSAETLLRDFGFRSFRVRFHDEKTARIEISPEDFPRMCEEHVRVSVVEHFKSLGFAHITMDLQGFRSGSMNETLSEEEKRENM